MIVEAFAHSVVMTTVKEEYRLHETISKIEELLGDGFLRCHRSYLVNVKYIKRIAKTEIIMDNNAASLPALSDNAAPIPHNPPL